MYPFPGFVRPVGVKSRRKETDMKFINEAGWDRILRVVLGAVLLYVGFGVIDGGLGIFLGILGFVPLVTGLVGWCPAYALFRFRTNSDPAA